MRDARLDSHHSTLEPGLPASPTQANLIFTSFGERDPPCGAIAAPVFGPSASLLGAISVSGPLERFSELAVEGMKSLVMSAARQHGTRICAGIVGHADLARGAAVDEVLDAHMEAGQGRFRGIRCAAAAHARFRYGVMPAPPLHLYKQPGFRAGYARLANWGLSFDSWAYHTQLGELYALARDFPDIPVVVDHIGVPLGVGPCAHQRKQVFDEWHRQMAALASLPHVFVKLGGLGMSVFGFDFHLRHQPPNSLELAMAWGPYIRACIDLFGLERCMFESNFPVDKGTCSYRVLWNAFKRIATGMSQDEKALLFSGTAARVYRLE